MFRKPRGVHSLYGLHPFTPIGFAVSTSGTRISQATRPLPPAMSFHVSLPFAPDRRTLMVTAVAYRVHLDGQTLPWNVHVKGRRGSGKGEEEDKCNLSGWSPHQLPTLESRGDCFEPPCSEWTPLFTFRLDSVKSGARQGQLGPSCSGAMTSLLSMYLPYT